MTTAAMNAIETESQDSDERAPEAASTAGWNFWGCSGAFTSSAVALAAVWSLTGASLFGLSGQLATASFGLLLALAAVTAYTDIRWKLIPNWATYTTFVLALALNLAYTLTEAPPLGGVGIGASLAGGFGLFFAMLVVFSVTGGGAGDVKFAGCLGALFGFQLGLESLITGYIIGAAVMVAIAIVKYGPVRLFMLAFRTIGCRIAPHLVSAPPTADRKLMLTQVPLGPFFAAGALLTLMRWA